MADDKAPVTRDAASAVRTSRAGARLQENSAGGSGDHTARNEGESFTWDPADKRKPNPQRPFRKG